MKSLPKRLEHAVEMFLFGARWILAPAYVGLVLSLFLLLVVFLRELVAAVPHILDMSEEHVILLVLSLIDISLALNLVLIVVLSGYENFVSKIDTGNSEDRPHWMGTLDFSGLKMKLIGSIVAISAISLLRTFMALSGDEKIDEARLHWMVLLHVTFLMSGVLFALMDWIASLSESHASKDGAN